MPLRPARENHRAIGRPRRRCSGYDAPLLASIARSVAVPVIALGGARILEDFHGAVAGAGCSAGAAGSMFLFQGPARGILISYPSETELNGLYEEGSLHDRSFSGRARHSPDESGGAIGSARSSSLTRATPM